MQRKKLFNNVHESFPKKELQPFIKKVEVTTLSSVLEGIMIIPMINLINKLDNFEIDFLDNEFESVKQYEYVMNKQNFKDILNYDGDNYN